MTSHKKKSLKSLLGNETGSKTIDVSCMDHLLKGKMTKRFSSCEDPCPEATSLSLLYWGKESKLESLDLVIPDANDYDQLWIALEELISIYGKEKRGTNRDLLALNHHWVKLEKDVDDSLNQTEWIDLCEQLGAPLKRHKLGNLYKEYLKELRQEVQHSDTGLPLWAAADLLNEVRFHAMEHAGLKIVRDDPLLRLWQDLMGTDPLPSAGYTDSGNIDSLALRVIASDPHKSISAISFLSFTRTQQKQFQTSLEDVTEIIHVLNNLTSAREIAGDVDDRQQLSKEDRLSKSRFLQYLFSDENDLLDPARGKSGSDDMTQPLSHYWINASHDTYWNNWDGTADEGMYLAALHRGVRCLELDVWDSQTGEPVLSRKKPTDENVPTVNIQVVLKAIRQFILENSQTSPIILNIENHCSFKVQEKLAEYFFAILGNIGLIALPDERGSKDEADALPSPASIMGKVLIMGKRPKIIEEGAKVVNDDYDDENYMYQKTFVPNVRSREDEDSMIAEKSGIVIGFDAAGPIKVSEGDGANVVKHSPGELLYLAKSELEQAKADAANAKRKASALAQEAKTAEKRSDKAIKEAGLTKKKILDLASQVKGVEIDPDEHVALLARTEEEGVEIQEFFADAVVGARTQFAEADQIAIREAEVATAYLQILNCATLKLREAEQALESCHLEERLEVYNRLASDARAKRDYADHAKQRVAKVRQLLTESETSASSAENVVLTAVTESKISEKRASETEARAARAATKAKEERNRADVETQLEEKLEGEASLRHEELIKAANAAKEAQQRMERASSMLDRVNEQIKLIEQSSQYIREKQEERMAQSEEKKEAKGGPSKTGKLISKHASKLRELQSYIDGIKKCRSELVEAEAKHLAISEAFEESARQWKAQIEVASKARKQADRSVHHSEELAEHAEEEREAANLRLVAREKATANVQDKNSYRKSLKAQLAEAERALVEAEKIADESRKRAEEKKVDGDDFQDYDSRLSAYQAMKDVRDKSLLNYEEKKKIQEDAEEKAVEAKRLFNTSENVYSQAMRNAAKEEQKADFQLAADRTALMAFNHAILAQKTSELAIEKMRYAESIAIEKEINVKRAKEYKGKMDSISEIPISLAKMTFLHTTKYRYWEKSLDLPNTHVHSFAQGALHDMNEKDSENAKKMKEFTSEHICRTFPAASKRNKNSDPLFQWAMGCQLVSMNYSTFDEHIIKADGRFRRNGSCGYVLKPKYDDRLRQAESWTISVLCGQFLPLPPMKKSGSINPFVKITVYGGDTKQKSAEHRTKVVLKNALNPVWDDKAGFTFTALFPSMSIIVFSVFDKSDSGEEFIAASAMPVSCMRQGFRSVALFDRYNSRSGAHGFASLLVRAQANSA